MGYAAARGGLQAIEAAEKLVARERILGQSSWLDTDQIIEKLRLAVDRVMSEGGLWDEQLAASALRIFCVLIVQLFPELPTAPQLMLTTWLFFAGLFRLSAILLGPNCLDGPPTTPVDFFIPKMTIRSALMLKKWPHTYKKMSPTFPTMTMKKTTIDLPEVHADYLNYCAT
jgi:hypothetical protein